MPTNLQTLTAPLSYINVIDDETGVYARQFIMRGTIIETCPLKELDEEISEDSPLAEFAITDGETNYFPYGNCTAYNQSEDGEGNAHYEITSDNFLIIVADSDIYQDNEIILNY